MEIKQILEFGTSQEKISTLETLENVKDGNIINEIILRLDDPNIQVRGEAFSSLCLNKNEISEYLIKGLGYESKNVRGFSALVLANREDTRSIPHIINLTKDSSSMVRACALGALGHLRAHGAKNIIQDCLLDENIEVRKSAIKAIIDIGESIPPDKMNYITKNQDLELQRLLAQVKKY